MTPTKASISFTTLAVAWLAIACLGATIALAGEPEGEKPAATPQPVDPPAGSPATPTPANAEPAAEQVPAAATSTNGSTAPTEGADAAEGTEAIAPDPPPEVAPPPAPDRRIALFLSAAKPADADRAALFQRILREQVGQLRGMLSVGGAAWPASTVHARIEPMLSAGYAALDERKWSAALAQFDAAFTALDNDVSPLDVRLAARTLKGRGVAHLMTGDEDGGLTMIGSSLNLWPGQKATEYAFSAQAYRAFGSLRESRDTVQNGGLDVTVEPAGSLVQIDGDVRGQSPVSVADLAPGLHRIVTWADGYVPAARFVLVKSGESAPMKIALTAAPFAPQMGDTLAQIAAAKDPEAATPIIAGLAASLGVDGVLALTQTAKGVESQVTGWSGGRAAPAQPIAWTLTADASLLNVVRANLSEALGSPLRGATDPASLAPLDGPKMPKLADVDSEEEDWTAVLDEWWFWTAVGGGAALAIGLGVGLGIGLADDDKPKVGSLQVNIVQPR